MCLLPVESSAGISPRIDRSKEWIQSILAAFSGQLRMRFRASFPRSCSHAKDRRLAGSSSPYSKLFVVMTAMVLVAVMAGHRSVGRNNRTGNDSKCDQIKQEIAKRLHGANLSSEPAVQPSGRSELQPTYRCKRTSLRKVVCGAKFGIC